MEPSRTLYIIPSGRENLEGRIFKADKFGPAKLDVEFVRFFAERGIELKTIDAWRPENHKNDDLLLVIGHPQDTVLLRPLYALRALWTGKQRFSVTREEFKTLMRTFKHKVLYQVEVPINTPYPHTHLQQLSKLYDHVLLFLKPKQAPPNVTFCMWPPDFREEIEKLYAIPKTKMITMINSNVRPKGFFGDSRYSERMRAVEYFSHRPDFDLYGGRWDNLPLTTSRSMRAAIQKVWRGTIPSDKLPVLAQYKFMICFENSEYPGYVSEKIFDCMMAGTIPIYSGAPDIHNYVPADCFIDKKQFSSYEAIERYITNLSDAEQDAYRARMKAYLYSARDTIFSKTKFAERIWNAFQQGKK